MEDEYEIVPINPLRKLEKRVDEVEKSGVTADTLKELIDIVKANQRVVDDVVKINSDMMNKVSILTNSVNGLSEKVHDFINRIELSGPPMMDERYKYRQIGERIEGQMDERLSTLEKRVNSLILSLSKVKTKRTSQPT